MYSHTFTSWFIFLQQHTEDRNVCKTRCLFQHWSFIGDNNHNCLTADCWLLIEQWGKEKVKYSSNVCEKLFYSSNYTSWNFHSVWMCKHIFDFNGWKRDKFAYKSWTMLYGVSPPPSGSDCGSETAFKYEKLLFLKTKQ